MDIGQHRQADFILDAAEDAHALVYPGALEIVERAAIVLGKR
jgi:hypothetical protein